MYLLALFPHTTKLTFSDHLMTDKWVHDPRSLFSHTLHVGCAHLRAWGHGYPRSGCNVHRGVCVCVWSVGGDVRGFEAQ